MTLAKHTTKIINLYSEEFYRKINKTCPKYRHPKHSTKAPLQLHNYLSGQNIDLHSKSVSKILNETFQIGTLER